MTPDAMGHDTPDFTAYIINTNHRKFRVGRNQQPLVTRLLKPFDRQFPMDGCNDDVVGFGRDAPVYDQQVTVKNSGITHGFTRGTNKEGCRWSADQVLVEVELAFDVIISR